MKASNTPTNHKKKQNIQQKQVRETSTWNPQKRMPKCSTKTWKTAQSHLYWGKCRLKPQIKLPFQMYKVVENFEVWKPMWA